LAPPSTASPTCSFGQARQLAEELEPTGCVQLGEPGQEQLAEQLGEDADRQEKRRPERDPMLVVERDAAATGHDTGN
jgi:hypothetical protein